MKKSVLVTLSIALVLLFSGFAYGDQTVNVTVNGRAIEFDVPPTIINGRTLVPLRAIFEELGAEIKWNGELREITAIRNDRVIKLRIDNKNAYVNREVSVLDVPPQLINNRTMIPVRFVSEAMGAEVEWNQDSRTVVIEDTYWSRLPVKEEYLQLYSTLEKFNIDTFEGNIEYSINLNGSSEDSEITILDIDVKAKKNKSDFDAEIGVISNIFTEFIDEKQDKETIKVILKGDEVYTKEGEQEKWIKEDMEAFTQRDFLTTNPFEGMRDIIEFNKGIVRLKGKINELEFNITETSLDNKKVTEYRLDLVENRNIIQNIIEEDNVIDTSSETNNNVEGIEYISFYIDEEEKLVKEIIFIEMQENIEGKLFTTTFKCEGIFEEQSIRINKPNKFITVEELKDMEYEESERLFKDSNLEKAVRKNINKSYGTISEDELEDITELYIGDNQIKDLSGIEKLEGLKILDLGYNEIEDITLLKGLKDLEVLYLEGNKIKNISSLKRLKKLKELHLDKNQIDSISVLKSLNEIEYLTFNNNEIENIDIIENLNKLKKIDLYDNPIENYGVLDNLKDLLIEDQAYNTLLTTDEFLEGYTDYYYKKDISFLYDTSFLGEDRRGNLLNSIDYPMVERDDWLYYSNFAVYQEYKIPFTKMNLKTNEKIILNDEIPEIVSVIDDWIYYYVSDYKPDGEYREVLYRMDLDGNNKSTLVKTHINTMNVIGDYIYYTTGSELYVMKVDGTEKTKIVSGLFPYYSNIYNGWIYYVDYDEEVLYRMNIKTREKEKLTDDGMKYQFDIDGEWIYYNGAEVDDSKGLYKMKLDGSNKTLVYDEYIKYFSIYDEYIFFEPSRQKGLQRINKNGTGHIVLNNEISNMEGFTKDKIYYENLYQELHRMDLDGSDDEIIQDIK